MRRVFAVDALVCPRCLGPMTVLAYLTDPSVVPKILRHLGLPTEPVALSPARVCGQMEMFADRPANETRTWSNRRRPRAGRGPPPDESEDWAMELDDLHDAPMDTSEWGA